MSDRRGIRRRREAQRPLPLYFTVPTPYQVRCDIAVLKAEEERNARDDSRDSTEFNIIDSYRNEIPSPAQVAAITLPDQAPLGGEWILLTSKHGWAVYWIDHSKPVDISIHWRPWSELGWHWMAKE
jgi:hypothetical protein